jgi:hypothetical protein
MKSPPENPASLENSFAALEVEELSEMENLEANAISAQTGSPQEYVLESPTLEKDKKSEKLFAIFCLFDDLDRLRKFLGDLWRSYKAGKVELITASVTTNTGIQLAIRTQTKFLKRSLSYQITNVYYLGIDVNFS